MNKVRGKTLSLPELNDIDTKTTVAHQQWILKPTNALFVQTVWDRTNDNKLSYKSDAWYWKQTGRKNTNMESKPGTWTPYGSKLYFYPTPNAAYSLEIPHRRKPTLFSDDDDTTDISDE